MRSIITKGDEHMNKLDVLLGCIDFEENFDNEHYPRAISRLALTLILEESTTQNIKFNEVKKIPKTLHTETEILEFLLNDVSVTEKERSGFVSLAFAIFTYAKGIDLAKATDLSLSMNMEAIRGELGAFDDRLHSLGRPYAGQISSASNTRRLLENSEMTTEKGRLGYGYDKGPRCQDAISYRAAPQTHGGVRDNLDFLRRTIEESLEKGAVNPYQLKYALDAVMIGFADLGNISERRSFRLTDSHLSYGLPTNLVYENPGFNHGFPVIQAVGTAVLGELKTLALPTRLYGGKSSYIPTLVSGFKVVSALELLSKVIAVEVFMSAQGMELLKKEMETFSFGKGTSAAFEKLRTSVGVVKENRYVIPDLLESDKLIISGDLVAYVENKIGKLE